MNGLTVAQSSEEDVKDKRRKKEEAQCSENVSYILCVFSFHFFSHFCVDFELL